MSKPFKPRRGTTAQHASFIGEAHEVTFDTDKKTLVAHDGATAGGFPLAKEVDVQALAAKDAEQDAAIAGKLDKSGGTMKGSLSFGEWANLLFGTSAYIYGPDNSTFTVHGGVAWDKCAKTSWIGKDSPNNAGDWVSYGYDPTDGTMTELRIDASDRSVKINSEKALTEKGGVAEYFRARGRDGHLGLWGGDYDRCARIALYGDQSSYPGELYLYAEAEGKPGEQMYLSPDGGGYLKAGQILTDGAGKLLNGANVFTKYGTADDITIPAGGTWAVMHSSWSTYGDYSVCQSYPTAGGSVISKGSGESGHSIFAIRIA